MRTVHRLPIELQTLVTHQIETYGCLVRFYTPAEALLIAGILPQQGPTSLVWELAGNACSPLLLVEALRLVSPIEIRNNFPISDLRNIWYRKLGITAPGHPPISAFPIPLDSAVFLRFENKSTACRFQGVAPMPEILARASKLPHTSPEDISLYLNGNLLSPDANINAYDLYGEVIHIE